MTRTTPIFRLRPLLSGRLAAGAIVIWASTLSAQPTPDVIERLELREHSRGADVVVRCQRDADWSATIPSPTRLEVTLRSALPGPAVTDLELPDGLVASVRVTPRLSEGATVIRIDSREVVKHSIVKASGELTIRIKKVSAAGARPESEPVSGVVVPAALAPLPAASTVASTQVARVIDVAEIGPPEPVVERSGAAPLPGVGVPTRSRLVATASDPGYYRIGPGDVIRLAVYGLSDFDSRLQILLDGSVAVPLIGRFELAGLTVQDAEARIAELLSTRRLVNDPQVTIFVEEPVSHTVSVQGAVRDPGVYEIVVRRSLLDVLAQAGGLSAGAGGAASSLYVLRTGPDGVQERIVIDTRELIDAADPDLNIALQPADIVMVPHAKSVHVYVSGAVAEPGSVEFSTGEGITVLQAITAAGGPTERSNLRKVHVIRRHTDGGRERIKVNVKKIHSGREPDLDLQQNDTVVVGEWFL